MRFEGTLKSWNDERGFGFIEPLQGGQEVFVHVTAFGTQANRPPVGQLLLFEVEFGPKGKKRAKQVVVVRQASQRSPNKRKTRESSAQWGTATLFVIPLFLLLYLTISILWKPPLTLVMVYLGASVLTFFVYWQDKSAAVRNRQRTPENMLHLLALAGGWPGALLAQQFLRHKSTKAAFRSAFWATVLLNIAAFIYICSPHGRELLALW